MKKYDTLIIGSSFFSLGYASFAKGTLIVEESEMLDTTFYLPMVGFNIPPLMPTTVKGRELYMICHERGIFDNGFMNVHALEIALCRYAELHPTDIYLKCRAVEITDCGEGFTVTLLHNGGLEEVYASRVIDTRRVPRGKGLLTVIFKCEGDAPREALFSAFPGSLLTEAFYKGRYALHVLVDTNDINRAKLDVCNAWEQFSDYPILYVAPVIHYPAAITPETCDAVYGDPISAFDAGVIAAGGKKV